MIPQYPPICFECARFDRASGRFQCDAFPAGIPEAIIDSEADHREPYDGDGGLRFVRDATAPPTGNPLLAPA